MRLFPRQVRSRRVRRAVLAPFALAAIAATALPACTVVGLTLTVTTTTDGNDAVPGNSVCEMTAGVGDCSLRAAVDEANAQSGVAVTVNVGPGTYLLSDNGVDDTNEAGDLDTNRSISIVGTGVGVVIDAAGHDRAIDNRAALKLQSVTVTGGRSAGDGGGVRSQTGSLALSYSTVTASASGARGGGVAVVSGSATISASTISGNSAKTQGGGIDVAAGATADLLNSTVSTNAVDPIAPVSPSALAGLDPPSGGATATATVAVTEPAGADGATDAPTAPPTQGGRVPVIVELNVDTEPEPTLPPAAVVAQRRQISARGAEALAVAGPDAKVRRTYATLPYVAVEASPAELARLTRSGAVRSVRPDTLDSPELVQSIAWVNADDAQAAGNTGAGTTVAILDSGTDLTHPMFAGKIVAEACFAQGATFGDAAGDCPNGTPSQTGAGAGVNCPQLSAVCWHGTHVAGIAAGSPISVGGQTLRGVAPGATIISVKVFSYFTGATACGTGKTECIKSYVSDQMAGLDHVYSLRLTHNIASVNMSLGGGSNTSACDGDSRKAAIDNLKAAGIATVIATGNDSSKTSISTPGCISTAVSVGASGDNNDNVASFSNSAPGLVDLLAPGVSITSAYPGSTTATANGTSMATPHAAGAFAVLHAAKPAAGVDSLLAALSAGGVPVTDAGNSVTVPRLDLTGAIGASGGPGRGGGIANDGALTLSFTTVAANSAPFGGGLATSTNVSLTASAVSGQVAGRDCAIDATGATTSGGWNLAGDGSCALEAATDTGTGAAQLGVLADNGGSTKTHLPAVGSPLVDIIPNGTAGLCVAPLADQRGLARPQGAGCDTGAVDR